MLPRQTKRTEIWGDGGVEGVAMITRGGPRKEPWEAGVLMSCGRRL